MVLRGHRQAVVVNFPNHGNPGDPAIWLGTRQLLAELDVRVVLSTDWSVLDASLLRRHAGVPVLLNGGGNFGDLYAGQQSMRERVLREATDHPVVQLPQSAHFRDPANLDRVRALVAAHPDVTLLAREERTLALFRGLDAEVHLSPDHALALRRPVPVLRPASRRHGLLWLARRPEDPEYGGEAAVEPPADLDCTRVEWMEGIAEDQRGWDRPGRAALAVNERLRRGGTLPRPAALSAALLAQTFPPLAHRWVAHGMRLLAGSRVVVTDKLHGHLFCVLLGLPHVALDNSYGKVSGTLDAWTGDLPGVHRARSGAEAAEVARGLLAVPA